MVQFSNLKFPLDLNMIGFRGQVTLVGVSLKKTAPAQGPGVTGTDAQALPDKGGGAGVAPILV